MPITIYLAALAVIVSIPILIWGLAGEKINAMGGNGRSRSIVPPTNMRDMRLQVSTKDRVLNPMIGGAASKLRRFTPAGALDEMDRKINIAGLASTWTVERLLATKLGTGMLGMSIGALFFFRGPGLKTAIIWLVAAGAGYMAPDTSLDRRGRDRSEAITRSLPDVLDQMTIGVEAGLGFDAALARVARENDGPLAEEFGRMMQDRQLGMSREEAFQKVLDRTDSRDLRSFVLSLTQATKNGMPLAGVLRVQAGEMRQKRRVRAEEKALSLPVKLVMPLALCILPSLFIMILGPAAFRLTSGGLA